MEYPQIFQTDFQKSHSFNDLHKRYFMGGKDIHGLGKKLKIKIIIKLYKGKDGGMPVKRVSGPEVGQAEDTTSDIKTT